MGVYRPEVLAGIVERTGRTAIRRRSELERSSTCTCTWLDGCLAEAESHGAGRGMGWMTNLDTRDTLEDQLSLLRRSW